jgi:histidinol phosphatase-like enzyme
MRLVIFDKDGTLTKPKSGEKFSKAPEDQQALWDFWSPDKSEDVFREERESRPRKPILERISYVVATNQLGVSLGLKSPEVLAAEIRFLNLNLGFPADFFLACPDAEGQECWVWQTSESGWLEPIERIEVNFPDLVGTYRKPNPGMLHAAIRLITARYGESPTSVEFIGDHHTDEAAAKAAGIPYRDIKVWLLEEWDTLPRHQST